MSTAKRKKMMPKVRTHFVLIDSLYVNVSIPQTPRAFICLLVPRVARPNVAAPKMTATAIRA